MTIDTYDAIELFGLTETDCEALQIPNDDEVTAQVMQAFEALLGTFNGTGLEREVEPMAHGFATMIQRHALKRRREADDIRDTIAALIRAADGSEVLEEQLIESQRRYEILDARVQALDVMAEAAATAYEVETNERFLPAAGSRVTEIARKSGGVFEARLWIEQQDRDAAARNTMPEGPRMIVDGDADWSDVTRIWTYLDQCHARATDLILITKGYNKGAQGIAAKWAKSRTVHMIVARPNFPAFGKAAPFRANDEALRMEPSAMVMFGNASGVAKNLADKAEDQGIRTVRILSEATT